MPPYDSPYHRMSRSDSTRRHHPRWRSYRTTPPPTPRPAIPWRGRGEERRPPYPERSGSAFLPYPRYGGPARYGEEFGEYRPTGAVSELRARMGLRDFSEQYGRYSGGSPYSYEYSERTISHRPRSRGQIGFTRPLEERGYGGIYRYGPGRREGYAAEEEPRREGAPRPALPYRRGYPYRSFRPYYRGRRW